MEHIRIALLSHSVKLDNGTTYTFDNRDLLLSGKYRHILNDAAAELWKRIAYLKPSVLVTKGYGGLPLVLALAGLISDVDVLIVRESRKTNGLRRLVEGPSPNTIKPNARAIFVDDLFNLGNTFAKAQKATDIDGYSLNYVGVAVLVDFWHNSRFQRLVGTPVEALFKRHDLGITRKDSTASLSPRIAWHVPHLNDDVGLDVKSWPRVMEESLFVGSDDNSFHCFDTKTGNRLWTHVSESPQRKGNTCVPEFYGDNVLISSYDGTVRALNRATGEPAWQTKADLNLHSSPTLHGDRIFIGTEYDKHGGSNPQEWNGRGDIICLSAVTGEEVWRHKTEGMIPCTPAYDEDSGVVVCASNDFHLYVLDSVTGASIYKIPTRGEVKGKPVVHRLRMATLSVKGWLQCFSLHSGELIWERCLGGSMHAWPLQHGERTYVSNHTGMCLCVNIDGDVEWMIRLRNHVGWGLSWLGNTGRLAALTMSGQLVTIDPDTGQRLSSDYLGGLLPGDTGKGLRAFQPVLAPSGTSRFFIATNNRGLLAIDYDL